MSRTLGGVISGEPWRLGHRPALDGLRGIAIVLVVACHVTQWWWPSALGSIGVTVFFTLSGFLITALLLEEAGRGSVSLSAFYGRRARRLFPALACMVAVAGPLMIVLGIGSAAAVGWVAVYAGNWYATAGGLTGLLGHTWSLAIEEQFYIVWPVLLLVARRWRHGPLVVVGVGILTSVALRFSLWDGGTGAARVTFGSDTRADNLLVGCGLAILLHSGIRLRVPNGVAAGLAAFTVAALLMAGGSGWAASVATPTIVPWVTALLLVPALTSPRWLTGSVLGWFGRRSYGIYLWNWPFVCLAAMWTGSPVVVGLATLAGLGVAELSWRFVERPFLRLRRVDHAREGGEEPVELGLPGPVVHHDHVVDVAEELPAVR